MSLETEARKTAVLITGMHRTGTSALARTLSLLGLALPTDLVAANEGNPEGHWEPLQIVELNDRMLAEAGSDLYSVMDIASEWFTTTKAKAFVDQAAAILDQSYLGKDLIIIKDPRAALLLPVWHKALSQSGYQVVHVLPLRHPADVAASLRRRHLKTIPYDAWNAARGEAVWLRYTLAAVRGSRDYRRAFIRYDDLLQDWRRESMRLGQELGLAWPAMGDRVSQDIDAFLHAKAQPKSNHEPVVVDSSALDACNLVQLAAVLHDVLVNRGDDPSLVDAIDRSFRGRLEGARDLVGTFENLFPLVWAYYTAGVAVSSQLQAARAAEEGLRLSERRMWSALTLANDQTMVLRQDLKSRIEQVASLEAALDRHSALAAEGCVPGAVDCSADVETLSRELASTKARCERLEQQALAARTDRDRDLAAVRSEIEALRRSTSWRITAPLRAASRIVRRRP